MRNDDIFLVGLLTYTNVSKERIIEFASGLEGNQIHTEQSILLARQYFDAMFPKPIQRLLVRWTLTLSDDFRQTVLSNMDPETQTFEPGIFGRMVSRYRQHLHWCRVGGKESRMIDSSELYSAVVNDLRVYNNTRVRTESFLGMWQALAAEPLNIRGFKFFLRHMLGANNRFYDFQDMLYNVIVDGNTSPSPWLRGQVNNTLLPNVMLYVDWLCRANPMDAENRDLIYPPEEMQNV